VLGAEAIIGFDDDTYPLKDELTYKSRYLIYKYQWKTPVFRTRFLHLFTDDVDKDPEAGLIGTGDYDDESDQGLAYRLFDTNTHQGGMDASLFIYKFLKVLIANSPNNLRKWMRKTNLFLGGNFFIINFLKM